MLNDVVADNTINKWLPFPYDWRMNVEDIARGKTTLASSSVSLIDSIEKLSKNSKTGKVIILAHSNGGLLAKSLMRVLEEKKEANIVEKIINVAVPELGAPKAVLSMLHGYDQSILAGVAMTRDNARVFSQNMTSAYSLLPSKKFFENNTIKIINDYFSNSAGKIASTYEGMKNFLLNNSFSKKSSSILNTPLLLNSALMNTANSLHSIFDIWKPASSTKTISLFGWGVLTPSAITYDKNLHCKPVIYAPCQPEITSLLSSDGDGTVLTNSNSNLSDKSFFLNLKTLKTDTEKEIKHADILESVDALNMIKKEIKNPVSDNEYGKYITSSKPVDNDKWLTIRILSPVDIDVYDKKGNHTGIKENYVPTPGIDPIENRIPNSYYEDFADSKRVILLYGEDYQIVLKGNDSGAVIVKASVSQYDNVLASTTFKEMPVTPLLNVELVIPTTLSSLATSSVMNMDIDGDGVTDFVNRSNEFLGATSSYPIVDFATYLESIKKVILSLKLSSREEKRWLEKIEKMAIKFNKSHPRKIERIVKNLSKKRFKNSPLTEVQKTNILKTFDTMLFELEAEK